MKQRRVPLPQGAEKVTAVRTMFDAIAPRYDLVNRVMTFGMDVRWRRRAVDLLGLAPGALVVDVACGTGDFCRELETSGFRAVGTDLSAGMLARARTSAPLVQCDALRMPLGDASADGVTCGFALRNVIDIDTLFRELARVVRPGGRVAILEVSEPESRFVRVGHSVYFRRIVPVIGGLLSSRAAYRYLPQSTAYLPGRDALLQMFRDSGFEGVAQHTLMLGATQIITGTRR